MSGFTLAKVNFFVDIPFYNITRLRDAAKLLVSERLFRYDQVLQGAVMAYRNLRPLAKSCSCYADSPFCHMPMEADMLVFRPTLGSELPAFVSHVSSSAISLQVFACFPAYLNLDELRENWRFDGNSDAWSDGHRSFGRGHTLVVEVTDVKPTSEGISLAVRLVRISDMPVAKDVDDDRLC
jgi:hypothetical protein